MNYLIIPDAMMGDNLGMLQGAEYMTDVFDILYPYHGVGDFNTFPLLLNLLFSVGQFRRAQLYRLGRRCTWRVTEMLRAYEGHRRTQGSTHPMDGRAPRRAAPNGCTPCMSCGNIGTFSR